MKLPKGNPSDWIRRIARPGDTVIDGGANVGGFTKVAAETVGPTGTVFAVEPDPRCAEALQALPPPVRYVPAALTQRPGPVRLYQGHHSPQSSLVKGVGDVVAELDVAGVTLDSLTDTRVRAVKLDLQGGESAALYGASRLMGACPYWCVELWPHAMRKIGSSPRTASEWIFWLFANFDYRIHTMAAGYPETTYRQIKDWVEADHEPTSHINVIFAHV